MPTLPPLPALRQASCGLLVLGLASCALPPREAWNQIRSQGLITFYMNGGGSQAQPSGGGSGRPFTLSPEPMMAANTAPVAPSSPVTPPMVSSDSRANSSPAPRRLEPAQPPTAGVVPMGLAAADLPGYVRSPHTHPPRLVDVRGMKAGAKVICPFTRKPFLVPAEAVNNSPRPSTVATTPKPAPVEKPRSVPTVPAPAAPRTDVAALNRTAAPEPKLEPTVAPKPAPTPAAAAAIPYGTAIPGRAGFVNSPFAAKHQLVDVTGLPAGMEVKCPYTGKLFRVPPQ